MRDSENASGFLEFSGLIFNQILTYTEFLHFSVMACGMLAVPGDLHCGRIAWGAQVKEWGQRVTLSTPPSDLGVFH